MSKSILFPIIIVLIVGTGYWIISRDYVYQAATDGVNATSTLSVATQEFLDSLPDAGVLVVSDVDTPSWKTYRNEQYGFEIKYPARTEPRKVCDAGECYIASEWFARENFEHSKLVMFGNNLSHADVLLEILKGPLLTGIDRLRVRSGLSSQAPLQLEAVTIGDRKAVIERRGQQAAYVYPVGHNVTLIVSGNSKYLSAMAASLRVFK